MAAYTTIDDPSAYFKVQLYTGNGSANHAITFDDTDTDMQPDFVWIKNRDATDAHCLFDAVRGATYVLNSDDDTASVADADTLDSFTSDGFQVDADVKVNTNTEDYVSWNWKANGAGSANTAGSINTTATSANTTSGFSIMEWTGNGTSGATVGHGLGVVPHFMIVKSQKANNNWQVYNHKMSADPETDFYVLNTTAAVADNVNRWNDVAPSSTLITLGSGSEVNENATAISAYIWTEIQGFSKFGSYVGNGNADGKFVYTGFKPAYVLAKSSTTTENWSCFDNKRTGLNPKNYSQDVNVATAGRTTDDIDILSNGFKCRQTNSRFNGSGTVYLYSAFAEAPFVNSNGVPCNAR